MSNLALSLVMKYNFAQGSHVLWEHSIESVEDWNFSLGIQTLKNRSKKDNDLFWTFTVQINCLCDIKHFCNFLTCSLKFANNFLDHTTTICSNSSRSEIALFVFSSMYLLHMRAFTAVYRVSKLCTYIFLKEFNNPIFSAFRPSIFMYV